MKYVLIGKIVNTHGLKGEVRILSSFKYKDRVFKKGNEIIIDKPYIINSYRVHKDFDMVTLEGINSINDILHLKNSLVYIKKEKYLDKNDYLDSDLIGFSIYCNNSKVGNVSDIIELNNKKLIEVNGKLIPFELVIDLNLNDRKIIIEYLEGLIWCELIF